MPKKAKRPFSLQLDTVRKLSSMNSEVYLLPQKSVDYLKKIVEFSFQKNYLDIIFCLFWHFLATFGQKKVLMDNPRPSVKGPYCNIF